LRLYHGAVITFAEATGRASAAGGFDFLISFREMRCNKKIILKILSILSKKISIN